MAWATMAACGLVATACGADAALPNADGAGAGDSAAVDDGGCSWLQAGAGPERTYTSTCASRIDATTAGDLMVDWFFPTADAATASPVVHEGTMYLGDWSGLFYAVDTATGTERWRFQADTNPAVYAGQITASAALGTIGGVDTVYFPSGKTVHALRTDDGTERWSVDIGVGSDTEPTEIEGAPLLVEDLVIIGVDVHNNPGFRAGVVALDAATGEVRWRWDGDAGAEPSGCVDVWGTASADVERRMVFFGTGNCPSAPEVWRPATEAVVAVDLDTGAERWIYQPHEPNNDDLDFASAPNLFSAGGRDLVGIGNKDGDYYALDRTSGALVWRADATEPGLEEPGGNFSTGGFIGAAAVVGDTIVGGTAVGPAPYLHGIATVDGALTWQQAKAQAIYSPPGAVHDVAFIGGTDFTLRGVRTTDGAVVFEHPVDAVIAAGPAVVGDAVYAPIGFKEPGTSAPIANGGVQKLRLPRPGETTTSTTAAPTTTAAPGVTGVDLTNAGGACIGTPCPLPFALKPTPADATPSGTIVVRTTPFSMTVEVAGLGEPAGWLSPGSDAAADGATTYAVYLSEGDDNPVGGLVCVLEGDPAGSGGSCTGDALPRRTTYNRMTILAVNEAATLPAPAEGLARLVTTVAFDPPLTPAP